MLGNVAGNARDSFGAPSILFVDDDPLVRRAFVRTLRDSGFHIALAANFSEGVKKASEGTYSVVAVDYRLPELDGLTLSERLRTYQPDATFVLISGECDFELTVEAVNQHQISFVVPKPWDRKEIISVLDRSLVMHWERKSQRSLAQNAVRMADKLRTQAERLNSAGQHEMMSVLQSLVCTQTPGGKEVVAHNSRVAALATMLGRQLGLGPTPLATVRGASWLRDAALTQTGQTERDASTVPPQERYQDHPVASSRLLLKVPLMKDVATAVAQHHERWDGSGFPEGLSGEETGLEGRIVALADEVAASVSRTLDEGRSLSEAFDEVGSDLRRSSGHAHQARVVDAYLLLPRTEIECAWRSGDEEVAALLRESSDDNH